MKKAWILLGLLLVIFFSSAFSLKEWRESVYEQIKAEALKEIKNNFRREIQIGQTEGIIVGQIVFKDVVVPGFARAKKVYLNFNLAQFAYKQDILPAITSITIEEGEFEVQRNKADQWNVLNLLPPEESGGPPPPPFRAKLVFKNCTVNYLDRIGFRKDFKKFSEKIDKINGEISFQRKDKIDFKLSGKIHKKPSPTQIKFTGSTNLKTGKFGLNISAHKVKLEKWGNYIVPFEPLSFSGGEADLSLKLASPKTKGWPLSLIGNFSFRNASGKLNEYILEKTFGNLSMADDHISFKKLTTQINHIPFELDGRFFDFEKQNLDLRASLKDVNLKELVSIFPETQELDLEGTGEALIQIKGTLREPSILGMASIKSGAFYKQEFAGRMDLSFKQKLLKMDKLDIHLYKGGLSGWGQIDFSKELPELFLKVGLEKIDLASLSQNSPGIVGRVEGELKITGPLNDLKGSLSANLSQAMFLGQPMDNISSSFQIKEGEISLESFSASSKTASIQSSGKISKDLNFDFQAQAQGIKLSGEGVLGKMEAWLDFFQGNVSWKLDEKFLASPLKNLKASGEAGLSKGKVGEQSFDQAQGRLSMGGGLLSIENVLFKKNRSSLKASGQTGIGYPTNLKVVGKQINLTDLKILNYILPEEAKNPTGSVDLNIEIFGEISGETKIVSLDPLLDLSAQGKVSLINVEAAELPRAQGSLSFLWEKRRLNFSESTFQTQNSNLKFDLGYENSTKVKGRVSGIVDFSDFRKFTSKYGRVDGKLGINLILQGEADDPEVATGFWIEDFQFNQINLDRIEGSLNYFQNNVSFSQPLLLVHEQNQYEISGFLNLEALGTDQPEESYLDLNLKIIRADLSSFIDLAQKIEGEFSRKLYIAAPGKKSKIDPSLLQLPTSQQFLRKGHIIFYVHDGDGKYFLKTWSNLFEKPPEEFALAPEENLGGKLSGNISLKGRFKNLSAKFSGKIENGFFRNFTFNTLRAKASLEKNQVKIEKLDLFKKRGILSARGEIDIENRLSMDITAKNFPSDILKILFDKEFDGDLDFKASLEGPLQNLKIAASLAGKNLSLAGIGFDKVSLSITKEDDLLFIHELSLEKDQFLSSLSGSIAFTPLGTISLEANLKDDSLGILNLFTDQIKWIQGKALARIKIKGTTQDPDIQGEINIENAQIYVESIDSEIKNIKGEAKIEESQLEISSLTGIWEGEKTKNYPNPLGLAGIVDLKNIFSKNKMLRLNLSFSPSLIYLNFLNLYRGTMHIKKAHLFGPFYFNLGSGREGLTLRGEAEINNAVITLAREREPEDKIFPLNFDLTIALNKNVYAVMGDIATLDLSSIFMNLEIKSEELKISGNLEYPSLLGKIFLKRGTVTIFNREFTLLSPELQKKYYPLEPEKIKENIARFTGEEGPEGIMPEVDLTAKVEVENLEEDETGEFVKRRVIILSHLEGVIGTLEKERGLKISFDSFGEDKTKTPSEPRLADYSQQEIKVMLLPDFIKALTGISKGEEVDANLVVADYMSSRLQTFVFRGIERELEQKLGLESLTLEYNFGKDLRRAMGVTERRVLEGEKPDWRVGFVKGFFDKFYIDVNYAQFATQTEIAQETFNYQLTYKLTPIWSIIYYIEPVSLQEPVSGYEKVTLKVGFSFW